VQVDELLERFEGVKGGNGQWTARCPAHDDRNASLTVAVGRDGQLLVTCWAGCNLEAIARAVGVDVRDLFPNDRDRLNGSNGAPQSLAALALPTQRELERYVVRLQGSPETLRKLWDAKGWRQSTCAVLELGLLADRVTIPVRRLDGTLRNLLRYSPNGKTPKMLAEQGVSRTPFYAFADDDGPVWIVEGEADGDKHGQRRAERDRRARGQREGARGVARASSAGASCTSAWTPTSLGARLRPAGLALQRSTREPLTCASSSSTGPRGTTSASSCATCATPRRGARVAARARRAAPVFEPRPSRQSRRHVERAPAGDDDARRAHDGVDHHATRVGRARSSRRVAVAQPHPRERCRRLFGPPGRASRRCWRC
jgi:hypothetical protein